MASSGSTPDQSGPAKRRTAAAVAADVRQYPSPILAVLGLTLGIALAYGFGATRASSAVFLLTIIVVGTPVVARTLLGMLHGRFASDVVASLAIVGAALTSEYLAGCIIVLMQTGGEALEAYAVRHASASLEALLARAPRIAHLRREDMTEDVPVAAIAPDDCVLVRPGEIVPVDGLVLAGVSAVDESALTGEPVPVSAQPGTEVLSGSICVDGALEIRALRSSSDSQYEQIVHLVQAAQEDKAPIGRLADRYAVFFTPFTLIVCALAYAMSRSPEIVVAVLVVATPCPLILATPVAIISGINRAARRGIIVKGGAAIEQVGEVTAVVFDKTGTLTRGTPAVERIVTLDGQPEESVVRLAAAVEQGSGHPMARALTAAGLAQEGSLPLPQDMSESAGQGVSGSVEGHLIDVGSVAYAAGRGLGSTDELTEMRKAVGVTNEAVAVVGIDGKASGLVVYTDPVRPNAEEVICRLGALGVQETAMLTGDDRATADSVGSQVGIGHVATDLLPGDKVDAVADLMHRYRSVMMVGDGINDAPALATATVGIALGAHGAAVSGEAADIVITTDDLGRVADTVEIGQHTLRIARQSIWIGLGLSGLMMVVAAFGFIPPAVGAMLQEGLDVGVILNALRAR